MKLDDVFSGNFLKAEELQGRTVRVTIEAAEVKEFDDGNKIVLKFRGKDKQLVANKTNANIIAENVGSRDTDDWAGQTIQLTVKKVEFQGKLVPAIRVVLEEKAPAAKAAPKAKAPPVEEEHIPEAPETGDDVGF